MDLGTSPLGHLFACKMTMGQSCIILLMWTSIVLISAKEIIVTYSLWDINESMGKLLTSNNENEFIYS